MLILECWWNYAKSLDIISIKYEPGLKHFDANQKQSRVKNFLQEKTISTIE